MVTKATYRVIWEELAVAEIGDLRGVKCLEAGGHDDGPHVELLDPFVLLKINRSAIGARFDDELRRAIEDAPPIDQEPPRFRIFSPIRSGLSASAAGISATFNAPIAGVLFAMEVILGSFAARAFGLVVVSSVTPLMASRIATQSCRFRCRARPTRVHVTHGEGSAPGSGSPR